MNNDLFDGFISISSGSSNTIHEEQGFQPVHINEHFSPPELHDGFDNFTTVTVSNMDTVDTAASAVAVIVDDTISRGNLHVDVTI